MTLVQTESTVGLQILQSRCINVVVYQVSRCCNAVIYLQIKMISNQGEVVYLSIKTMSPSRCGRLPVD